MRDDLKTGELSLVVFAADLHDVMMQKAAVGHDLRFNIRVEFGGETAPAPEAVEEINELLSQVSDDLKLA